MTREEEDFARLLTRYSPSAEEEANAGQRVYYRFLLARTEGSVASLANDDYSRPVRKWRLGPSIVAVATTIALLVLTFLVTNRTNRLVRTAGDIAVTQPAGDPIRSGQPLQASRPEGMLLALRDGSRVEMRTQSQAQIDYAADGLRIHLSGGNIIVTAAKQGTGHLYVETRDAIVSVVGTVFAVTAEQGGSRVGVIEGVVNVKQGATEIKLFPGQQLSTNLDMPSVPIAEEIAWSRKASAHLALLRQAAAAPQSAEASGGMPQKVPASVVHDLEFAAASIKLLAPGTEIPGYAFGVACRGSDGMQRVISAAWSRPGESQAASTAEVDSPQGRCSGNGVFLKTLIQFAYGIPPTFIFAVPDWAGASAGPVIAGNGSVRFPRNNAFRIDAVADSPATTTVGELKQMLRAMLAARFKLQTHRERHESQGYALVIAKGGPKLKTISGEPDSVLVLTNAKSTMSQLTERLMDTVNAPVTDRTGLTGLYEYQLRLPLGQRGRDVSATQTSEMSERAADISAAMEAQLGLRLQVEKVVPFDVLVIDHAELPSPN